MKNTLSSWYPELFFCLKKYSKSQFFSDIKAGLLVAIVAFPLFMIFAIASGVSPFIGITTCVVAGGIASLLGGARFQIVGPTGAFTIIVFNIIQEHGFNGLITALFFASLMIIAFGLCKMGNLIRYIPYPITSGFTSGIGLSIIVSQIGNFLGMQAGNIPVKFFEKISYYFSNIISINMYACILGVASLIALQILQKKKPNCPRYLMVIFLGIVYSYIFGNSGMDTIGTKFGHQSFSFPSFHFPDNVFSLKIIEDLLPSAFAIAFLGSIENLLGALISDNLSGKTHRPNLELVAQGIANLFSSFFGGIPATCALGTTSLNVKAGAKTPLAGVFNVCFIVMFVTCLGKWIQAIPMASLAAMLISAAWSMAAFDRTKYILLAPKRDSVIFITTIVATLVFDIVFAVELGLVLSMLLFIKTNIDTTDIDTVVETDDNGSEIVRIKGNLFFGTSYVFSNVLNNLPKTHKSIQIDMHEVAFVDASGARALREFVEKVKAQNIDVYLVGLNERTVHVLKKMDKKHVDLYGHIKASN